MIIYKLTNKVNGKNYIGQTIKTLEERMIQHIRKIKGKKPVSTYLHKAMKGYGVENFKAEILCECNTKEEMNEKEAYYITYFDTFFMNDKGYNMTYGGEGSIGYKPTDETKQKISIETKKGIDIEERKKRSKRMAGRRNIMYGRKRTDEEKDLISKNRQGKLTGKDNPAYKSAPDYLITFPDGHQEIIKGLRTFCRDNGLSRYIMNHKPKTIGYNVKKL